MIDLSKYTHYGHFKLHSGKYSDTLYDIKEMITNDELPEILDYIETNLDLAIFNTIIGIESAGAIIASQLYMMILDTRLAIITKDDKLIGKVVEPYILIDDACSTENTIRKAIEIIGKEPEKIFVVVDRRDKDKSSLKIDSMFKV